MDRVRVPLPPESPNLAVDALNTGSRLLLSVLPFGSVVVTAWDAIDSHVASRTWVLWAAELTQVVERIERRTDRTWEQLLSDDGFCDAVGRASRVAETSRQQATRRALCNALLSVGLSQPVGSHADEVASLIGLLANVTPSHMRVLGFLEDPVGWCERAGVPAPDMVSSENPPGIRDIVAGHLGGALGWDSRATLVEDLITWGLVPMTGPTTLGTIGINPSFGPDREMLTAKARAFLDFVRGDFGDPTTPA